MSTVSFYYTETAPNGTRTKHAYSSNVREKIKNHLKNKEQVDSMQSKLNSLIPNKVPIFVTDLHLVDLYATNNEISKQFYIRTLCGYIHETKDFARQSTLIDGLLFPIENVPEKITIKYRIGNEYIIDSYTIGKIEEKILFNEKEYFIWQPDDFIIPMFSAVFVPVLIDAGDMDVKQIIPICGYFGQEYVIDHGIVLLLAGNGLTMPILNEKFKYYIGAGFLPKK
jgi:hypothetical protein